MLRGQETLETQKRKRPAIYLIKLKLIIDTALQLEASNAFFLVFLSLLRLSVYDSLISSFMRLGQMSGR